LHKTTIIFENNKHLPSIYGEHNGHLAVIEKALGVEIGAHSNECVIASEDQEAVELAEATLKQLEEMAKQSKNVDIEEVKAIIRFMIHDGGHNDSDDDDDDNHNGADDYRTLEIVTQKGSIRPRTPRQAELMEAVYDYDMVFALGPAGTGKTYLAVALAVDLYLKGDVERIIFCRPAVEAGERLGFLPGDMEEKIAPYLRPMHDALFDMMSPDKVEKARSRGEIEIAPLAFMRGRTLNNAAIVLDEAQNTTPLQMKMFLTRLGNNSRMIISGDPSQADLPSTLESGLHDAERILSDVREVAFVRFTNDDVVRHDLVGKILKAYDRHH